VGKDDDGCCGGGHGSMLAGAGQLEYARGMSHR
jgi:hypothetical protein